MANADIVPQRVESFYYSARSPRCCNIHVVHEHTSLVLADAGTFENYDREAEKLTRVDLVWGYSGSTATRFFAAKPYPICRYAGHTISSLVIR